MLNSLRSRWNLSLLTRPLAPSAPSAVPGSGAPSTRPPRSNSGLRAAADTAALLPAARAAFEQALEGLAGEGFTTQRGAIRRACSLQDLWHLRTALYNEIAVQMAQSVAEQRLAALNGYFDPANPANQGAPR